jgi:hypothetical protein
MLQDNESRAPVELEVRESPPNKFNLVPLLYDSFTEYCNVPSLKATFEASCPDGCFDGKLSVGLNGGSTISF